MLDNNDLIQFGEDNIDDLTVSDKLQIICSVYPMDTIIKKMHYDNIRSRNFLISENKDQIKLFTKNQWYCFTTDESVEKLLDIFFDFKVQDLYLIYYQLKKYIDANVRKTFIKYLKKGNMSKPMHKANLNLNEIIKTGISMDDIKIK